MALERALMSMAQTPRTTRFWIACWLLSEMVEDGEDERVTICLCMEWLMRERLAAADTGHHQIEISRCP